MENWQKEQEEILLEQTTIVALDSVCEKYLDLRAKENEIKIQLKAVQEEKDSYENSIIETLKRHKKTNWATNKGLFSYSIRLGVQTPKDPASKKLFFDYLKEKGLFEHMITVNSQTLNAFYKEEFKAAQNRGEKTFVIPGIQETSGQDVLSFRSK